MGVTSKWLDKSQTMICYNITGQWTWDELWTVIHDMRAQSDGHPYPIDIVADFTESRHVPNDALTHLRKLMATRPTNRRLSVFICPNNVMIRSLVSMAKPLLPRNANIHLVDTMDEALAVIQESRAGSV